MKISFTFSYIFIVFTDLIERILQNIQAKALREKYLARKAEEKAQESGVKVEEKKEEKPKVESRMSIGEGPAVEVVSKFVGKYN